MGGVLYLLYSPHPTQSSNSSWGERQIREVAIQDRGVWGVGLVRNSFEGFDALGVLGTARLQASRERLLPAQIWDSKSLHVLTKGIKIHPLHSFQRGSARYSLSPAMPLRHHPE